MAKVLYVVAAVIDEADLAAHEATLAAEFGAWARERSTQFGPAMSTGQRLITRGEVATTADSLIAALAAATATTVESIYPGGVPPKAPDEEAD